MKKLFSLLAMTSVTLLLLSGCAALQGQDVSDDPVSDEGIGSIATSRLNGDPMTARSMLSVEVDNGLATLYGTVPNEATRQRAIQILEGTPGIFEVLDHTRRR
jgi:osmotically-inducible protein OsmY